MRSGAEELDRQVRHGIYRHFAEAGAAPSVDQLTAAVGRPLPEVEQSLDRLADAHAIVLAPSTRNVWMAHPFSAVPTSYPVRSGGRTWWANCAWDALGIPAVLDIDAETRTQCPDCGEPIALRVAGGRVEPGNAVVHFLVPPKRFWENVGFT